VITHAALLHVSPQLAAFKDHRWDSHFRVSTVLGIFGAGSVDYELVAPHRMFDDDQRVRESYHDLGLCCGAGKPGRSAAGTTEVVLNPQRM
jgi:hypothetical protein